LLIKRPLTLGFFLIAHAKISTIITKKLQEIGHPCLMPLDGINALLRCPLLETLVCILEYIVFMQLMKYIPKFIASKHLYRKFHLTVSKAFS
jgi:hypothetical protein